MRFASGLLSSIGSAAFVYAAIPAPPTFAGGTTTTITTGSSAISVANTAGNRNLLIPATFNQRLRPNNLPGTGLSPYRIKSASDSVRSWVGGSNMTASNYIVGAFNGSNHCYYYHLGVTGNPSDAVNGITGLYGNAIAGSGSTFIFSDIIVKDVTFAGVRINDGITGSSYQNVSLKYVRVFGYPIEGEGVYVGNTSKTTYSIVTNSTYENLFLYNKGRDGFQINNNANFYANKITVLNVGIENASAQRSLIQIQNCNGTLENSIFYNAPKLGVVCGHNLTFNNCYFYFTEQGDLQRFATEYTSSPMANHLPIVFNNCHFGCSTSIASAWDIQEDGCNISFINCTKSSNITALYTDNRSDKSTYTLTQSGTANATTITPTFNNLDWSNENHGCITSSYHYSRGLGYRILNAPSPAIISYPAILGSNIQGSVLTGTTGSWSNSPISYTYKWKRNGTTISTSNTYTTVSADTVYNTSLTFEVTATNGSSYGVATSPSKDIIVNMATFVNKYWTAASSYSDTGATTIVTNNSPVRVLKGLVTAGATTSNNNLAFIGTTTGKVQKESNGNTYGSTVPYPKFYSGDSFIGIVNTLPQRYETGVLGSISGAFTGFFLMRLLGGTSNEYYFSASNTFSLRDRNDNDHLEIGKWNTAVEFANGSGVPENYKLQLFEIERNSTGGTRLWINQSAYAGGAVINTGTNNLSEFAIGSNSHNTDNMFHAAGYVAGARDSVKSGQIRKALEQSYGALNSYPLTFPVATFGTDSLIWNNSLNRIELPSYTFRSPHSATEGATEVRWYSGSTSVVLSCENRTYLKTQIKGVDAEFGRLYRGSDFGTNPETPTGRYYCAEILAVDNIGRRQTIEIKTKFLIDNVT